MPAGERAKYASEQTVKHACQSHLANGTAEATSAHLTSKTHIHSPVTSRFRNHENPLEIIRWTVQACFVGASEEKRLSSLILYLVQLVFSKQVKLVNSLLSDTVLQAPIIVLDEDYVNTHSYRS